MTRAQENVLHAIDDGRIELDRNGCLIYDAKAISPSALAACRRRHLFGPDWDRQILILTAAGREALNRDR